MQDAGHSSALAPSDRGAVPACPSGGRRTHLQDRGPRTMKTGGSRGTELGGSRRQMLKGEVIHNGEGRERWPQAMASVELAPPPRSLKAQLGQEFPAPFLPSLESILLVALCSCCYRD